MMRRQQQLLTPSALTILLVAVGCASSPVTSDSGGDTGIVDSGTSDVGDTGRADTSVADTGAGDTGAADTSTGDTSVADSAPADTGMPPMDTSVAPVCGDGMCGTGEVISCEDDCDLIPTMTSNSTPMGLATSGGDFSASYPAWHAFDSTATTMTANLWLSELDTAPAWVAYEFAGGDRTVVRYGVRYTNGSLTTRAPRDWQFQGWNGSAWVTLDTQVSQTGWTAGEWRRFAIATPGPYPRYRLYITEDNDSRMPIVTASIGELAMWGM